MLHENVRPRCKVAVRAMRIGTAYLLSFDRSSWRPLQPCVGFTRNLPQRLKAPGRDRGLCHNSSGV
jgi:hypothetical protein